MRVWVVVLLVGCAKTEVQVAKPDPAAVPSPSTSAPDSSSAQAASAAPSTSTSTNAAIACPEGMVAVHAGAFALAKTKEEVTVGAHCLDKREVSVADYQKCVDGGKCTPPQSWNESDRKWCNWKRKGRENDPVNCVDHAQAVAFCAFRGGRLPTEAEWEWSARGYEAASKYPWGNDAVADRACWDGPGNTTPEDREGTCPVGTHPKGANQKGVLDLAGNVWEWTATAGKPGTFVDRGGCWANAVASRLLAGDRNEVPESQASATLGFRCAK